MIAPALVALALGITAHAHGHGHHHAAVMARAAVSGSSTSTSSHAATTSTTSSSSTAAGGTTTTSAAAGATTISTPAGVTVSTASGAVPLASIVPNSLTTSDTNLPTYSTPAAGSKPTNLASAPGLPDISQWSSMQANYPSADPTVAIDLTSSEVQGWIQDVKNSGVTIPNIATRAYTSDNNCVLPANVARESTWESEGWWTCGHYTRSTDITECTSSGVWGSSFDDGPSDYSPNVLNYMAANSLSTTFFTIGSAIYWRPWVLQAEYIAGHQIAVHTWNHHALTNQTNEEIIAELGWTKKIMKDVTGVTPLYMRPPYGDIDDRVRAIAMAMNLTPVIWTVTGSESSPFPFDTFDWEVPGGDVTPQASVSQFYTLIANAIQYAKGFIVLEHDLFPQEVDLSLGYFLPTARANGFKIEPVYACAGQTLENAYAETQTNNGALPGGSTASNTTASGSGTSTAGGSKSTGGSGSGAMLNPRESLPVVMALTLAGAFAFAASL